MGWVGRRDGIVKLLADWKNVDLSKSDMTGRTPLLRAIATGCSGVARLLLGRREADPATADQPPANRQSHKLEEESVAGWCFGCC